MNSQIQNTNQSWGQPVSSNMLGYGGCIYLRVKKLLSMELVKREPQTHCAECIFLPFFLFSFPFFSFLETGSHYVAHL